MGNEKQKLIGLLEELRGGIVGGLQNKAQTMDKFVKISSKNIEKMLGDIENCFGNFNDGGLKSFAGVGLRMVISLKGYVHQMGKKKKIKDPGEYSDKINSVKRDFATLMDFVKKYCV